jgi:UDP-N-acetylglucosamine transferase subunit ALG13
MCTICRSLERNKITVQEAREKYEEMIDLIDEDHQEEIENTLAEAEEELMYWKDSKKFLSEDFYEEDDEDYPIEDQLEEYNEDDTLGEDSDE